MKSSSNNTPLLGSEACARGALEAGVKLATGYPGTPATPAIEYLLSHHKSDMRVEWAVNEKVAFDVATGHSWAGQRSFMATKMSGLNVASDSLLSVVASGTIGGLVVMVGDDPGVHYGMVEQDSRLFAKFAGIPCVEPSTPMEAKELTFEAYEVSEKTGAPILLRMTTATANTRGPVAFEEPNRLRRQSALPDDVNRFTKISSGICLEQHERALERLSEAGKALDHWNILTEGTGDLGIITTGSAWRYVAECLEENGRKEEISTLRLTVTNPLPEEKIVSLLKRCKKVLVAEELEPVIEDEVRILASSLGKKIEVLGKRDGAFSRVGSFDPDRIERAILLLQGKDPGKEPSPPDLSRWADRSLTFCPGCPHRSTYTALTRAIRSMGKDPKRVMVTGDIGCTILGMKPPFSLCRTEVSMGASIAMAQGFAYAGIEEPIIATIGDSTFFHAGIPALLNASARNVNITVIVLDNSYAAMTGFQPTPSTGTYSNDIVPNRLELDKIAKAAKVGRINKIFPYYHSRLQRTIAKALQSPGVNVIIAEAPCASHSKLGALVPYQVKPDKCRGFDTCEGTCIKEVGCPAIDRTESGTAAIDISRCMGCGLCATACAQKAIKRDVRSIRNRKRKEA